MRGRRALAALAVLSVACLLLMPNVDPVASAPQPAQAQPCPERAPTAEAGTQTAPGAPARLPTAPQLPTADRGTQTGEPEPAPSGRAAVPSFIDAVAWQPAWACDGARAFHVGGPQKSGTLFLFAVVRELLTAWCAASAGACSVADEGAAQRSNDTQAFRVDWAASGCVWRFTDYQKHDYRNDKVQQHILVLRDLRDRVVSRYFYSGLGAESAQIPAAFAKDWTKRMLRETVDIYTKYAAAQRQHMRAPGAVRGVGGGVHLVLYESLLEDVAFEARRLAANLGLPGALSDEVVALVAERTRICPAADPLSRAHVRVGERGQFARHMDRETQGWLVKELRHKVPRPLAEVWLEGGDVRGAY